MRSSWVAIFFLAHVPLALWMDDSPDAATVHAAILLAAAFWWAVVKRSQHPVALAAAYIMGAEVLWRMTEARIFWETAKYAISALFFIALLRRGVKRINGWAVLYLALLLPSAILTLVELPLGDARDQLSFNLSGPLSLAMSVLFFTGVTMTARQFQRLLLAPIGPLAGVAAIAIRRTLRAEVITFTQESNIVTSGGFGPNQVAAVLGLGAFLALFFLLHARMRLSLRAIALATMTVFAIQSTLTFSRGGMMTAGAAAAAATLFLIQERRMRDRILQLAPVLFVAGSFWVAPRLDEFTGGALSARYHDTSLGSRGELFAAEMRVWREHPLFGAGPGMAKPARDAPGAPAAAHTEFSRLLAEHGLFGLAALLLLALMTAQRFSQALSPTARAMVLSMITWSMLFQVHSAMRLAAPGFLFGLAFANPMFRAPAPAVAREQEGNLQEAASLGD